MNVNYHNFRLTVDTDGLLTDREQEVLILEPLGKTDEEKAQILGISPATVTKHKQNIREKIGVSTTTQAVSHGFLHGWIKFQRVSASAVLALAIITMFSPARIRPSAPQRARTVSSRIRETDNNAEQWRAA